MIEGNDTRTFFLYRFIARLIDLLIAGGLMELTPRIGWVAGILYLFIADGLLQGQSPGKWLIGLRTVVGSNQSPCTFRESIARNLPLAAGYSLFWIPYVGWILTTVILAVEGLLTIGNEQGLRMGDELAGTTVVPREVLDVRVK